MYIIQRYNGHNWDEGYIDKYGEYSDFTRAQDAYMKWQYDQPTSAWRLIVRLISEAVLDQVEPN